MVNYRVSVLCLAALIAAGGLAVAAGADSAQGVERISYSQYGFEIAVPRGSTRIPAPAQMAQASRGFTEGFSYRGAAAVVHISMADEKDRKNLEAGANETAAKMGGAPTSFTTAQGVRFFGASGTVVLTKEMLAGMPPSLGVKPGMQAKLSMYAAPLPTDTAGILAFVFAETPDKSAEVDLLSQTVLSSITFSGLRKPAGAPAGSGSTSEAPSQGITLSEGQIALKGKVETISAESKSLTMLADEVIAYGKSAVNLSPARQKVINYPSLPDGVSVGSRILVIGPNAGTGKPMTAVPIVLEK